MYRFITLALGAMALQYMTSSNAVAQNAAILVDVVKIISASPPTVS